MPISKKKAAPKPKSQAKAKKKAASPKKAVRKGAQKKGPRARPSKAKATSTKSVAASERQSPNARRQRTMVLTDASKVLFKWMPVWVAHNDGPRSLDILGAMSLEEVDRLLRGWIETAEGDPEASERAASAYSQLLGLQEQLNFLIDRLVDREVFGPAEPEGVFAV